jgi:hypothetical protein
MKRFVLCLSILSITSLAFAEPYFFVKEFTDEAGFTRSYIRKDKENFGYGTQIFPANFEVAQFILSLKTNIEYKCDADVYRLSFIDRGANAQPQRGFQSIVYRLEACEEVPKLEPKPTDK